MDCLYLSGPEYGTMEAAWKAVLVEADRRCELHNKVKENLNIKANNQLKQWQKDNYHKVSQTCKRKVFRFSTVSKLNLAQRLKSDQEKKLPKVN